MRKPPTPTGFRELRDRLENEFADLLKVDLAANDASAVHIVLTSETDLLTCGQFSGLHSPRIHRWLRSYIPRWTGNAPAFLIDDTTIGVDCGGRWSEMETRFVGICTHELAHVCCVNGLYALDDDHTEKLHDVLRQEFVSSLEHKATFDTAWSSPRIGHGPDFLRIVCHLVFRLQQRGRECRLPQVVDSNFYSLSTTAKYRNALGDECERLAAWPLTSVATIPPPQKFLDQWNADLVEWPDGEF